ncbi:MAG: four helix bundle protein [Opitutaceae bacterium]|nr:four helix bundle protein [Opitutaceae bacterium]
MGNIDANRLLEERTLLFAVGVVRFVAAFAPTDAARIIGRQLIKCGTSIGANYREANRAESREDFVHKSSVVLKESSETDYWLELCTRTELGDPATRALLAQEARELLAIFTTINRNAKGR